MRNIFRLVFVKNILYHFIASYINGFEFNFIYNEMSGNVPVLSVIKIINNNYFMTEFKTLVNYE